MICGDVLRGYWERVRYREVYACPLDSENSTCATLCNHLSNSWALCLQIMGPTFDILLAGAARPTWRLGVTGLHRDFRVSDFSTGITWEREQTTDLYIYSPDTVPPIHVVSYQVAPDKFPPAKDGDKFRSVLATIYNQSQLAERKHVARYWSINTVATAVP